MTIDQNPTHVGGEEAQPVEKSGSASDAPETAPVAVDTTEIAAAESTSDPVGESDASAVTDHSSVIADSPESPPGDVTEPATPEEAAHEPEAAEPEAAVPEALEVATAPVDAAPPGGDSSVTDAPEAVTSEHSTEVHAVIASPASEAMETKSAEPVPTTPTIEPSATLEPVAGSSSEVVEATESVPPAVLSGAMVGEPPISHPEPEVATSEPSTPPVVAVEEIPQAVVVPVKVVIAGQGELTTIPDKLNFDEYAAAPPIAVKADGTGTAQLLVYADHGTQQDGSHLDCTKSPCWIVVVQEPFLPQPYYATVPISFGTAAAPTTAKPVPTTAAVVPTSAATTVAPATTAPTQATIAETTTVAPTTTEVTTTTAVTVAGTNTSSAKKDDGSNTGLIVGGIIAAVVILGGGGYLATRRKPGGPTSAPPPLS